MLAGFAGATADAFTLIERLEAKLEQYPEQLARACVDLAKDWRTDRYLRRLEAMLIVADKTSHLHRHRRRRRAGAGIRRRRHRLGRPVRPGRRPGADRLRPDRRGDRPPGDGHRRRHLRLHQRSALTVESLSALRMTEFSPREIVSELDRFIVGHAEAKRAVAVALRNRWRRRRTPDDLRDEITPKNILMIGPTGVGKTEIARRLARLAQAPFLKVEATKFTEVGYVGRDVDQIMRDLVESALAMVRDKRRGAVRAPRPRPPPRSASSTPWSGPAPGRRPATASARSCAPASWTTRRSS